MNPRLRSLAALLLAALFVSSCLGGSALPAGADAAVPRDAPDGARDDLGAASRVDADVASADRGAPPECARDGDCDDGVACTADRCVGGRCLRTPDDAACDDRVACTADRCGATGCERTAVPARCATGQTCDPMRGCTGGRVCGTTADCVDADPCTTNERCDAASRVCLSDVLDGDGDGFPPRVCGGTDCDDGEVLTHPMSTEECNGRDDDCDAEVDEQAACFGGTGVCRAGRCECPSGRQPCFAGDTYRCVDPATDRAHCGECNRACGDTATGCRDGLCQCPAGATRCGTDCVDLQTTAWACGACDRRCGAGETCVAGACACAAGRTRCDGRCADTRTDTSHCGACGRACPWDQPYCVAGACSPCAEGRTECDGRCVDTRTDTSHCGACGGACGEGYCLDGACRCPSGLTRCGARCVDLQRDAWNCGACGTACVLVQSVDGGVGAGEGVCAAGRCECAGPGRSVCSYPSDGGAQSLCTNTLTTATACGACGRQCARGREFCSEGACQCFRCDGVCTDLSTDENCGGCGQRCPGGLVCTRSEWLSTQDGYYCARPSILDGGL